MLEIIAKIIGYHFWDCRSDKEAIACGMGAAQQAMKALKEAGQVDTMVSDDFGRRCCSSCATPPFESGIDEDYYHCNIACCNIHKNELDTFHCSYFEKKDS